MRSVGKGPEGAARYERLALADVTNGAILFPHHFGGAAGGVLADEGRSFLSALRDGEPHLERAAFDAVFLSNGLERSFAEAERLFGLSRGFRLSSRD